jgi:hypothetical protein
MNVPETKYAVEYLLQRGIKLETAFGSGIDISANGSHPRGVYRSRLGFDVWDNELLSDLIEEGIWFPCIDGEGTIQSYFLRPFPPLTGTDGNTAKFLTPKNGNGYPFILPAVWQVAVKCSHPLFLTEGPVKALAILQAGGLPIGLGGVWMATRGNDGFGTDLHPVLADGFQWRGRKVYLVFDADFATNPSVRQALIRTLIVLHEHGANATVLRWPIAEGKGIDDYLAAKTGGTVPLPALFAEMCNAAVLLPGILETFDLEHVEMELIRSRLKGTSLEQLCRLVAKPLNVRASRLLEEILEERRKLAAESPKPSLPNVTPRALPVILEAICEVLRRYVVFPLPEEQPVVIALWVLHTWLFVAFDYTPSLSIYSPAWRSGKSRLLEVLKLLCRNPEMTSGASAAALIRTNSETDPPTLLLDEMDTMYSRRKGGDPEAENTRRFLNAGYERGATFLRCAWQGKEIVVQRLPAFCPKALAAIGQCLPETVEDRSIPVEIQRQGKEKRAEKLRKREAKTFVASLRDELEVLSAGKELLETLNKARPVMPEELNDRQQDICEPLLAIADHAGGDWPEKARAALVRLYGRQDEERDLHIRLLADIKRVFEATGEQALSTQTLLTELVAIADDAPWPEWFEKALKDGQIKSAGSKLAYHMKRYRIKPVSVRIDDEVLRGYQRDQFKNAWERYLPPGIFSPPSNSDATNATDATKSPIQLGDNVLSRSIPNATNEVVTFENRKSNATDENVVSQPSDTKAQPTKEIGNNVAFVASVASKIGDTKKKSAEPAQAAPEPKSGPETRLGYMQVDQMLDAVREIFSNAKIIPSSESEPPTQPELPLS